MPYFLAIDAGGTKTQCLLADSTRILARASTGSIKLMRVSEQEATGRLHAMLDEVAASAGISPADITRTCFGLAGLTIPAVRAWATAAIAAKVSGDLILCGDEEIALDAAFTGGPGILVIAGTGSNVIGRAPGGRLHGAGGWGPILGDEGAGFWIGLEAIRAALRAHDADPPSSASPKIPGAPSIPASSEWVGDTPSASLLWEIQRHWNLDSLAELVAFANHRGDAHQPAPDFAALAPIVARSAEQGNPVAADILRRAGEDLADLVTLVAQKISADLPQSTSNLEPRTSNLAIAYTGSVLAHIAPVRAAMTARLAITVPSAQVQQFPVDPLEGALWRARHP
jgi:glucosamine kinase